MNATITGPSFIALQVRDVEAAAAFYEHNLGLTRAPQGPPGAAVFQTAPIPFAVRPPTEGTDLDGGQPGLGVVLWLQADDLDEVERHLSANSVEIPQPPFQTPFGRALVLRDLDGYLVTVHER